MGKFLLAAAVASSLMLAAGAAAAGTSDEESAGLDALDGGNYDQAIVHLSRALNAGALGGDEAEFAYAKRGRAYLLKGDLVAAIADLDRARRMKPDDVDAQTDLIAAISAELPASAVPGAPQPRRLLGGMPRTILRNAEANLQATLALDDDNGGH